MCPTFLREGLLKKREVQGGMVSSKVGWSMVSHSLKQTATTKSPWKMVVGRGWWASFGGLYRLFFFRVAKKTLSFREGKILKTKQTNTQLLPSFGLPGQVWHSDTWRCFFTAVSMLGSGVISMKRRKLLRKRAEGCRIPERCFVGS